MAPRPTGGADGFLVNNPIANRVQRDYYPRMKFRSTVVVTVCAGFIALAIANLVRHHYWFAAMWLGLGVAWLFRAKREAAPDDSNAKTLDLDSTPRPQSPSN